MVCHGMVLLILNMHRVATSAVRQTTMAQMSNQADTNALIAATVHGKGLKPSQPSTTPSTGQPPTVPDQRMVITPGHFSITSYCYISIITTMVSQTDWQNVHVDVV